MKKIFFLFIITHTLLEAQFEIQASMGLDFKSTPSYRDYINSNFSNYGKKLSTFSSAVNFSGEVGYSLSNKLQIGIEISYLIDSYNANIGLGGIYEISYTFLRPSIITYYIISGSGYKFKVGGGIGPRFVDLTEENIIKRNYSSKGYGLLLKLEGNTFLGDNLYALIGFDLRLDLTNDLKNTSTKDKIINYYNGEALNMTSLSAGIKLGITYIF
ncbi:MAG: hypothetical protein N2249_06860 [Melioribacter sp.]|nr:hypothetical protein [Melioribacter sp.]